jgi:hypothetical protein
MREWWASTELAHPTLVAALTDEEIVRCVRDHYPGGVVQFLADHKEPS